MRERTTVCRPPAAAARWRGSGSADVHMAQRESAPAGLGDDVNLINFPCWTEGRNGASAPSLQGEAIGAVAVPRFTGDDVLGERAGQLGVAGFRGDRARRADLAFEAHRGACRTW